MKLVKKLIKLDDKNYPAIEKIYKQAFPANELMEFGEYMNNGYKLLGFYEGTEPVGMIFCYIGQQFAFICDLAVKKDKRNLGYGSAILDMFKSDNKDKCVVLNIEHVFCKCANEYQRACRLQFYLKNGLVQSNLLMDWHGEILNTMYYGTFDAKSYIHFLTSVIDGCSNFRQFEVPPFYLIKIPSKSVNRFCDLQKKDFDYSLRRSKKGLESAMSNNRFSANYILNKGKVVGYIDFWEFDKFIFIEHFAIFAELRDCGIGTSFLKYFISNTSKNIIFEIEQPKDEISKRRANFYNKLGFTFNEIDYIQPSYHGGKHGVPLKIMSYKHPLKRQVLQEYIKTIYLYVYNKQ
jgi:ribosomal protein S18 acetylase RimI-like enzyme